MSLRTLLRWTLPPLALIALAGWLASPSSRRSSLLNPATLNSYWSWFYPTWKCVKADGSSCGTAELSNPYYKQVVILPSGFAQGDIAAFWTDFDKTVALITSPASAGSSWSVQRAGQVLFVGYFLPGGALGTDAATFGGKVAPHPIRGYALSLSQGAVYAQIDSIRYWTLPQLRPFGAAVLFNTFQTPVTANAAPPSLVNKPFGVARFTRQGLVERGAYVPAHELAHASLNYLDEYVEAGFEDLSMKQIDIATPLVLMDGSWGGFANAISDLLGVYDFNISEILSNNGNDNMSTVPGVSSVWTPNYAQQWYGYAGGMFFGMANNFLPTLNFPVPYQDVGVPASQWFTTYWWRFATWNGATSSGYTGWSSFYRSF